MKGIRRIAVPYDHLIAEMAAEPLVDEVGLRNPFDRLSPFLASNGSDDPERERELALTQTLWRHCETRLSAQMPAISLEELVAYRDLLWFRGAVSSKPLQERHKPSGVDLHVYVRELASHFLSLTDDEAVPHLPSFFHHNHYRHEHGATASARRLWRWVALALPADLLIAAHPRATGRERGMRPQPETLAQSLRDRGFAEMHAHQGAAVSFPTFWSWTLRALADSRASPDAMASPAAPLKEGKELAPWLLRAALARQVLGIFLSVRAEARLGGSWKGQTGKTCQLMLQHFLEQGKPRYEHDIQSAEVRRALRDLLCGTFHLEEDFHLLRAAYAELTGIGGIAWDEWTEGKVPRDPLDRVLMSFCDGWVNPEIRYMREALNYLEELECKGERDPMFSMLLWQTVRIRCMYFRYLVVRPLSVGLQWFIRFFERTKTARRAPQRAIMRAALQVAGHGQGLRSVEFRLGPPGNRTEGLELARELYRATMELVPPEDIRKAGSQVEWDALEQDSAPSAVVADGESPRGSLVMRPEVGFVLHFGRDRGGGMSKGVPNAKAHKSEADPTFEKNKGVRYLSYYKSQRRQAEALRYLFLAYPASLSLIRGIDVCKDELGIPNWVFKPLFKRVREAGDAASRRLQSKGYNVPPLRVSAHAGEDFVHLLTGLRRIDESLTYLACQPGDRLGHGVALGVDPETWVEEVGMCVIPREERLFDLLWEWRQYGHDSFMASHGRAEFVAREIQRRADEIFDNKRLTPYLMKLFVDSLYGQGGEDHLLMQDEGRQVRSGDNVTRSLVKRYLKDEEVFERCVEPIVVDPKDELEALVGLQLMLRRKVGARGVEVEINPTSNLLTGNLADLERHPLWRLHPPRPRPDLPPLDLCIGSDDPLSFNTTLPEEYQRIYDMLGLCGLTEAEAWRWLNAVRTTAFRYRFTLSSPPIDPESVEGEVPDYP